MTLFPFDATTLRTDWPSLFPEPYDLALYLWELLTKEPSFSSLEEACEWALVDSAVYDELRNWAIENKAELSEEARLMLFDVFVHERPKARKARDEMPSRNARLTLIFKVLVEEYKLPKGRNDATVGSKSASAIINALPGIQMASDRSIANLLGTRT